MYGQLDVLEASAFARSLTGLLFEDHNCTSTLTHEIYLARLLVALCSNSNLQVLGRREFYMIQSSTRNSIKILVYKILCFVVWVQTIESKV